MTQAPITRGSHSVRFFQDDGSAHHAIAEFFSEDARPDDCFIMVARVDTFAGVRQVLAAHPATHALADRIRFVAAREGLAHFVTGGKLNQERAEEFFLEVLSHVPPSGEHTRVRLYGEGVDILCERDQHAIALEIEDAVGLLFVLEPRLSMLCGYRIAHLTGERGAAVLRAVCSKHTDFGPVPVGPDPANPRGEKTAVPGVDAIANSSSRIVYIVDDDASMRRSLARLLALSNLRAHMFDSAEAFLKGADALYAGCVVVDIQLGGMTGLELIAQLAERGFRLPLIAMSGFLDEKTESEVLRLGVRAFLHKPFEPDALIDAIENALR